ncbi:MAG: TonB-dependent receptor, partial [Bacteroidota bacterium]
IFFRGTYGNDIVNANLIYATSAAFGNNAPADLAGEYYSSLSGDASYQRPGSTDARGYFRSEVVEDGSFLRLESMVLGYTFRKFSRTIKNLRVYVSGNNLLLFTRYSWFDPEANSTFGTASQVGFGKDQGAYPRARTFRFGVNASF